MDYNNTAENNRNELIFRFLNNELSVVDETELMNWINNSPENFQVYEQLRAAYIQSTTHIKPGTYSEDKAWEKMKNLIYTGSSNQQQKKTLSLQYLLKVAAAVVLLFLAGFFTSRYFNSSKSAKLCEIRTPLGSKTFLTLPDGSQVWLNAGSKLIYGLDFNEKDRIVSLSGEAFFKVKTNKNKPFVVKTSQMNVRAYGTSFNVKAYDDDNIISTTLVEGIVKVDGIEGEKPFSYTLKPSQNITIKKDITIEKTEPVAQIKKQKAPDHAMLKEIELNQDVKVELHTSWKDEKWELEGESLSSLAVLLERRFNTQIYIESEKLYNYKFTGNIKNETLEQVLQILSLTTPLKYKIGKGEVWWDLDTKLETEYQKILKKRP